MHISDASHYGVKLNKVFKNLKNVNEKQTMDIQHADQSLAGRKDQAIELQMKGAIF